jgi:hypothetical protein
MRRSASPQPTPDALPAHSWSDSWSGNGQLSICIDPDTAPRSYLATTIDAAAPTLVSYGWNGGRRASIFVPAGRFRLTVPLADHWGRNMFFLHTLVGGPAAPVTSTIEVR